MNFQHFLRSLDPLLVTFFLAGSAIIVLVLYLVNKLQTIGILKKNIDYLNQTVQSLDQEAKLIIKSDMELKLYQEEVEDKLDKLVLLKNIILSSLQIMDREHLFRQIDEHLIQVLGFKKGLMVTTDTLEVKTNIGFSQEEIDGIIRFLSAKKELLKTTYLFSSEMNTVKELKTLLERDDYLLAPIKARSHVYGIFLVSDLLSASEVQRGEKEIFSIVCMYLGQCLDNINLFEELYQAKDDLEKKVNERTNELVKSLRKVETISRMKSNFISSVSHELRTPLTSVKGFSSLLVKEKFGKLPEKAKARLEKIDENVDKLVKMVNTLLDISRIESGKMEINIVPDDIAPLISEVADLLLLQAQAKRQTLQATVPETCRVFMDRSLIERVLINLTNNAIKFTPEGGTITLSCSENDGAAVITVKDTGYGMDEESQEKIFQEFYRVDNPVNRQIRGSGLGLSLVKRIIDSHKQNLWLESQPEQGTTFSFTLKKAK